MTTVRELADSFPELHEKGATFDYAIPITWCDDVKAKTGIWPQYFVWFYPKSGENGHIWGKPFPLNDEAKETLQLYEAALNGNPNNSY